MDVVQRIFDLIKRSKKTAREVANGAGIPASNFTEWKMGRSKPSADKLSLLADYFDVSVDYLLGRTEDPRQGTLVIREDWSIGPATEEERIAVEAFLAVYRATKDKEKK
jgi:transcriptional regulator with XRE-family HTH domain